MLYRYYLDSAQAAVWKAEKTREIRSSASSADSPCSDRAGARYIATVRRCTKYFVRNRTALNHLISKPCETTIFFQLVRRCQLRLWLSLRGEYRKTVNGAQLLRETNFCYLSDLETGSKRAVRWVVVLQICVGRSERAGAFGKFKSEVVVPGAEARGTLVLVRYESPAILKAQHQVFPHRHGSNLPRE
jgi:hypothetical protein